MTTGSDAGGGRRDSPLSASDQSLHRSNDFASYQMKREKVIFSVEPNSAKYIYTCVLYFVSIHDSEPPL